MARDTVTTVFTRAGGSGNIPYTAAAHAAMVEQRWSNLMFKHGLANNPLKQFMGKSDNSIIQVNKDFAKKKGDKITFHLRALLTGSGQGDDGTLEGNEEAMTFYDNSVQIHERGHATKVNGIMTEQRTSIPLRAQGKDAMGEWIGRVNAADIISALSGVGDPVNSGDATKSFAGQVTGAAAVDAYSSGIETVNGSQATPGRIVAATFGGRIFYGGQTTAGVWQVASGDSTLDRTSHRFGTRVISYVKLMAKAIITTAGAAVSPIRPVKVDGKSMFVMLLSPYQARDLKLETAWINAQKDANWRGSKNPLFTGALGVWDGVILHECDLIHFRYGENGTSDSEFFSSSDDVCSSGVYVARGLFCGAQAGLLAFGQKPTWKEKMFDYGAKWGISTRMIYGAKKSVFNSRDFGVIAVDTTIDPNS